MSDKIYVSGINPRYVLRNWMAESAIRRAETNEFSEVCFLTASLTVRPRWTRPWFDSCTFCCYQVELLHQVLSSPFVTQEAAESAGFAARPPTWAESLRVSCSSWVVHRQKGRRESAWRAFLFTEMYFQIKEIVSEIKYFILTLLEAQVSYSPVFKRDSHS